MSSKRYYNESYTYHDNWCNFLNEQGGAAEAQAQAQAEAQRAQQEEQAMLEFGQALGQYLTIIHKLGPNDANGAKATIGQIQRAMASLALQELNPMEAIDEMGKAISDAGNRLQAQGD